MNTLRIHPGRLLREGAAAAVVLLSVSAAVAQSSPAQNSYTNWSDYAGSADSMQYSALTQINKTNVHRLEQAWFYRVPGPPVQLMFNPIVVDGVLYVLGERRAVVALDPATGTELWRHSGPGSAADRGISYWESKDRTDRRLILTGGGDIRQLNARTGGPITSFGDNGRVNVRVPSPGNPRALAGPNRTPPRIFEDLMILGSNTGEGYGSPPGDIRAYDVRTGALVWTFRTIPIPGDFGYDTWPPEAWQYAGGANNWGEMTLDEKSGIVFVPTGSPTADLYGADRVGANLFGNSLIALDARTGKRLWHFQTVHHDLWDYDLSTSPKLLTVRHEGRMVDIVAQATKTGFLYVFHRMTGEPLWPIEERPVPVSEVPGEVSYPTQPFPTRPPPFSRQTFSADDVNPHVSAEEQARIREAVLNAANEGVFTPSSHLRHHIQNPGAWGGANWGCVAADPETGMLYVRTFEIPTYRRLSRSNPRGGEAGGAEETAHPGRSHYMQLCAVCHGPGQTPMKSPLALGADGFKTLVRSGREQMPGFTEEILSGRALDELEAYLTGIARETAARAGADEGNPLEAPLQLPGLGRYSGPPVRYSGDLSGAMLTEDELPAIKPPWSELVAYDMNDGTIKWRVPNGTAPGLAALGITDTGAFRSRASPVVTAGGLVFLASRPDGMLRAYDKETGEVLWRHEVDVWPQGIPAVYEAGGRQYVIFAAGAGDIPPRRGPGRKPVRVEAQGYYVFALPSP